MPEEILARMDRRQGQPDAAHAEPKLAGHLQQPRANRPVLSPEQRRAGEADRADGLGQDPGNGREIQPQLVGPNGRRRGPVGEQVELLLLYSVSLCRRGRSTNPRRAPERRSPARTGW